MLETAIKLKPGYRRAWIQKGRLLIFAGDVSRGLECFSTLKTAYSNDPEILNEIGVGLCSMNRQEDAIPVFEMALNLENHEAEVLWSNKGRALAELGKSEMALDCYEEALRIEPTYALALVQSADLKHELGDLKGAAARYMEALKIDPQNHKCWFERGSALLGLDENESAIQSLDRALAIHPSNKKAIYNKGVALFRLGRATCSTN